MTPKAAADALSGAAASSVSLSPLPVQSLVGRLLEPPRRGPASSLPAVLCGAAPPRQWCTATAAPWRFEPRSPSSCPRDFLSSWSSAARRVVALRRCGGGRRLRVRGVRLSRRWCTTREGHRFSRRGPSVRARRWRLLSLPSAAARQSFLALLRRPFLFLRARDSGLLLLGAPLQTPLRSQRRAAYFFAASFRRGFSPPSSGATRGARLSSLRHPRVPPGGRDSLRGPSCSPRLWRLRGRSAVLHASPDGPAADGLAELGRCALVQPALLAPRAILLSAATPLSQSGVSLGSGCSGLSLWTVQVFRIRRWVGYMLLLLVAFLGNLSSRIYLSGSPVPSFLPREPKPFAVVTSREEGSNGWLSTTSTSRTSASLRHYSGRVQWHARANTAAE